MDQKILIYVSAVGILLVLTVNIFFFFRLEFYITCKEDECSGNGECILKENNEIGCRCNPGFSGLRCEKDKFNDYECICEDGWIGKDCNHL
ncbi:EGF-like domain protein [Dictyocaulus viviparus]|uniref:EGF-like domain protein n=1 Tax=Dictyocaulus viviparus TaxID=29172 RepID=A0A0D8Y0K0_DICVI|nr:EGF-like domain protein [Dictyocaulus viviparus]